MKISTILKALSGVFIVLGLALGLAVVLGGPATPAPLASINDPFKGLDYSDLPPARTYQANDGASLAYRAYPPPAGIQGEGSVGKGSVVLVHGSSASSQSMHILARALARAGHTSYALDIRGHGASGPRGRIDHVGQLEDDLRAFVAAVPVVRPRTLLGFSSGGGLVLRFAGSPDQDLFEQYVLLSPFLGSSAPNYRPDSGGWIKVGIPRIVGLSLLNQIGIQALNDLPVIRFALNEQARKLLTPDYTLPLLQNFGPQRDYEANIKAVHQPVKVIAGADDEAFATETLEGIFRGQGRPWPVTLLPGINHIQLTLDPVAVAAIVAATEIQHD